MSVIEVRDVGKRYRSAESGVRRLRRFTEWSPRTERWALRNVSFSVSEGETVGLIGRNGSGKSTLLRLLAGLTRPTAGSVEVRRTVSGLLTLGEGFHPLLSARENAVTQSILSGLSRRQAFERLPEIAAFAELEEYMERPLRTFSDGMRLRLGFSVAISVEPEVLLIDEILRVGDLRFQQKCFERLDELRSSGVTIVVASHDLMQVRRSCGRAVWLSDGRVLRVGDAREVVDRYEGAMTEGVPRRATDTPGGERLGTGEVTITGLRLLDASDLETSTVLPGAAATVEITFYAAAPLPDAIFVVSAHSTVDEALRLDVSTAADGHAVGELHGEGTVRLHLERVDFAPGSYWLNVGVYEPNWDRPYDYVWQALPFEVDGTVESLRPPHWWSRP